METYLSSGSVADAEHHRGCKDVIDHERAKSADELASPDSIDCGANGQRQWMRKDHFLPGKVERG